MAAAQMQEAQAECMKAKETIAQNQEEAKLLHAEIARLENAAAKLKADRAQLLAKLEQLGDAGEQLSASQV